MKFFWIALLVCGSIHAGAFTRQDTLRGSNGRGRSWWDVQSYGLDVRFDTAKHSISGFTEIVLGVLRKPNDSLQIDLQEPMVLDSVLFRDTKLSFAREGNVYWVTGVFKEWNADIVEHIRCYFHGSPRAAVNPPWDGGFIWTKDSTGKPWIAVACQGLGASVWWPCKDYQGDKPDMGMNLRFTVPDRMTVVSNGRRIDNLVLGDNRNENSFEFQVAAPINNYDATFYIGNYTSWTDTLMGEKGPLELSFYALKQNEDKARAQFAQVKPMLHAFEYWLGPYPFYDDGYKIVEAPYLGMEHQSAIAYGNGYQQGYKGRDRSGSGNGLDFDFIIIHESGHEWFGNNITASDMADNWIHEGFTTYTEGLFEEWIGGREKAFAYTTGEWHNIRNDKPVIGSYGVNDEGTGDIYDKGSALVHMIRMTLNDDEKFRQLLRALNQDFAGRPSSSKEIERFISRWTRVDFAPLFQQYLRTLNIPRLEYRREGKMLTMRFQNVVDHFSLPVFIPGAPSIQRTVVGTSWTSIPYDIDIDPEFSKDLLVTYQNAAHQNTAK